jgi:hypothetical protein
LVVKPCASVVPFRVIVIVPISVLPFAVFGTFQKQLATPPASEWVARSRTPLIVATHVTVAFATGPEVSLSVAASVAVSRAPAFAGFGVYANAVCFNVSLVITL